MKNLILLFLVITTLFNANAFENSIGFIENKGQIKNADSFQYYLPLNGYTIFISAGKVDYVIKKINARENDKKQEFESMRKVTLSYLNCNNKAEIIGQNQLKQNFNYYIENKEINASKVMSLIVKNIYKGIDIVYKINNNQLEYDYIVHPGADVSLIKMKYSGSYNLLKQIDEKKISILTDIGLINENIPKSYIHENNSLVDVSYKKSNNIISFDVPNYDNSKTLIIDPLIYTYSSFIGGGNEDIGVRVKAIDLNYAYVMGRTQSNDYPVANAYDNINTNGGYDIFLSKININTNTLLYSTYVGGNGAEEPWDMDIDNNGNVYVAGYNSGGSFPTSSGSYQPNTAGLNDAFLFKMDSNGSMVFSTYFGGSNNEYCYSVYVDNSASTIYIGGLTESNNLPMVNNSLNGSQDGFIAKFDLNGQLVDAEIFGGSGSEAINDLAKGISITGGDAIAFTGETFSTDLPTTSGAYSSVNAGGKDAIFGVYDFNSNTMIYLSYIGGNSFDAGIAINSSGAELYITGNTTSTNFPTLNAFDNSYNGSFNDIMAFKFNYQTNNLLYSTFIGSNGDEQVFDASLDQNNSLVFVGYSTGNNYPVFNTNYPNYNAGLDMVLTSLNSTGNLLDFSTYFGTVGIDQGKGVCKFGSRIYTTGFTETASYPFLSGYDNSYNGGNYDAFLTIFEDINGAGFIDQNTKNTKLSYIGEGIYSLETNNLSIKKYNITVFDLLGNALQPEIKIDNNSITINLQAFADGAYIIQYENEKEFARYKVIK